LNIFLFNPERKHIVLLVNVFLTVSVFYFFSSIFFGLDFTDSFYHLNQALNPADGIYLYPFFLSSIIIKGLINLVGSEVIYLRFFNSLMLFFSFLIPFFLIKIHKPRVEVLFYIACGLFLFTPFNVNILGYDSISIFILSLIFSLSVLYLQKANLYLLLLLSFICSLAVLIRLPNILVVPIVFLVMVFSGKLQKGNYSVNLPVMFMLLTIFFILFGFSIYYANLEEFFAASANSSSHDFKMLFYNYFLHGLKMLLIVSLLLAGHFIFKKAEDKMPKYMLYAGAGLIFIILIGLFVVRTKYSQNYSLFLTSLALSVVIVNIIQNRKDWLNFPNLALYLYILFLFINPFGSNTGLLKAASLFLLLPFILSFHNFKPQPYWVVILVILLPFALIEKLSGTYEDKSIPALNTPVNISLLTPISTTKTRAAYLEKIDMEVNELKKNNFQVYFYGDKSHIFHYLYPATNMNINSFFQPVDELVYYPKIEQVINGKQRTAIFIVDSYPGDRSKDLSSVEFSLIRDGFKRVKMEPIIYYLRIKE
jgi:hypothetical protein